MPNCFPKVVKPIYTYSNNEGEDTIFRVLAYMPETMRKKEKTLKKRTSLKANTVSAYLDAQGSFLSFPNTCPQLLYVTFASSLLFLILTVLWLCAQVQTASVPDRLCPLWPSMSSWDSCWPLAIDWPVYTQISFLLSWWTLRHYLYPRDTLHDQTEATI